MIKNTHNKVIALPTTTCLVIFGAMQILIGKDIFYKGIALSLLGSFVYLVCFIMLRKHNTVVKMTRLMMLTSLFITISAVVLYFFMYKEDVKYSLYGNAENSLAVSIAAIHLFTGFLNSLIIGYKFSRKVIYKDRVTGELYIRNGAKISKVKADQSDKYSDYNIVYFTNYSELQFEASFGNSKNSNDASTQSQGQYTLVNPSTGASMVGGVSGIDTTGHTWGG